MIHLTDIYKQQGERVLFRDASIQVQAGDKIGLVGPNGAGKSTIFRSLWVKTVSIEERSILPAKP